MSSAKADGLARLRCPRRLEGRGMETPRAATCSLFPEQEPRLAPGEKHEAKRGQSGGRRRTKALLWGRNPGWPRGSLRPPRGPRRPARGQAALFPRLGLVPFRRGEERHRIGTEGAARRARGDEDRAAGRGHPPPGPAPPSPWRRLPHRGDWESCRESLCRLLRNGPVTSGD